MRNMMDMFLQMLEYSPLNRSAQTGRLKRWFSFEMNAETAFINSAPSSEPLNTPSLVPMNMMPLASRANSLKV